MSQPLLAVDDLTVTYTGEPPIRAVEHLDLRLEAAECLAIVGESGSGKSTLAHSLLGLATGTRLEGSMRLGEVDLASLDERGWRQVRWRRIALVFQSTQALNPVLRVGNQIVETLRTHLPLRRAEAQRRTATLLEEVGLGAWAAERYPGELSGGQKRLALVAMALTCDPELLVLDEPTSGLDPFRRQEILALLAGLRDAGRGLLVFTHDIAAAHELADRVGVLYRGWLAESGPAARVLDDPRNPYTAGLLNAYPTLGTVKDLRGIRGTPPDATEVPRGCPFLERCTQAIEDCKSGRPPLVVPEGEDGHRLVSCVRGGLVPILRARNLSKTFEIRSGIARRAHVTAVAGISLEVRQGEVLGVVGPTGAGKSTLGALLLRMIEPDGGSVELEGRDLLAAGKLELKAARRRAQLLQQDPFEAVSPRLTVAGVVLEPLEVQGIGSPKTRREMVRAALESARLPSRNAFLDRHTHELSGGQLQRVALARALVLEPKLLIADEAVAMLDPSEQTKLLQLLKTVQVERGMGMIFISHELAVVLRVADRVAVLDAGGIVEEGSGTRILTRPSHPVTRRLLAASGAVLQEPSKVACGPGPGTSFSPNGRQVSPAAGASGGPGSP